MLSRRGAGRAHAPMLCRLRRGAALAHARELATGPVRGHESRQRLRSQEWFDNPSNPGMTALYLERYLNFGLTREELQSGRPIVGIAQTGSDLSPCNKIHVDLASRVRDGIRDAGGLPLEFPCHPIQETGRRPTAALDRNLTYLALLEVLHGYPLDGVVLTTGCDKTTPALLMAAASADLPAIVSSGGPMLNGWWCGSRAGSGTVIWDARRRLSAGEIEYDEFVDRACSAAPSLGHCNTMGTASTMNALAEALGMSLPGCAAIPAPYRERAQMAYRTGVRAVGLVRDDVRPSAILTREAFLNAIRVNTAIGGSTNAPPHLQARATPDCRDASRAALKLRMRGDAFAALTAAARAAQAIARHAGVSLNIHDWQEHGFNLPLLVNMQPAGEYLVRLSPLADNLTR